MLLVYVGPHAPGVQIPALSIEVLVGVPFEVEDEGACAALLAQVGNYEVASPDAVARFVEAPAAAEDPTSDSPNATQDTPAMGEEV